MAVIAEHKANWYADWRNELLGWLTLACEHRTLCPGQWQHEHHVRLWHLLRWIDEPAPAAKRDRPNWRKSWQLIEQAQTEADLLDQLGPA